MREIFRNMWRRKFRTGLTVFGIIIGIFALTFLGAMAEKMNKLVDGGIKYMTGQISIGPKGSTGGYGVSSGLLDQAKIEEVRRVDGIDKVQPQLYVLLQEEGFQASFGTPPMAVGADLNVDFINRNWATLEMKEGRDLQKGEHGKVVVGSDMAQEKKAKVGGKIKVKDREFDIIGIAAKTLTAPDNTIMMNIEDLRPIYINENPYLKAIKERSDEAKKISPDVLSKMDPQTRAQIEQSRAFQWDDINTSASASWKDGVDAEKLTQKIKDQVKDVSALSPNEAKKSFEQLSIIFNIIILGSALIALIVGGLSVINTMIMSVSERTREIGLKKALGARNGQVLKEYIFEAALIGFLGGAIGIGLGIIAVLIINDQTYDRGIQLFEVTPRLVVLALAFAVFLGTIAGLIPARRAAKLKPVQALKEE